MSVFFEGTTLVAQELFANYFIGQRLVLLQVRFFLY